jgi:hypothetical protein
MEPEDGAGMLYTIDGSVKLNHFLMRVELSHIEGKVYDLLYSTRSKKVTPQERLLRVQRLESILSQWRAKIPGQFQLDLVSQTVPASAMIHMTMLFHCYLTSLVMVHGIYSHDADWVQRISTYGRVTIGDCDDTTGSCQRQLPPLPSGWQKCVETSRACMRLFGDAPQTDCTIW